MSIVTSAVRIAAIVWLITVLACQQPGKKADYPEEYVFDFGLYFEKLPPEDNAPDRFTRDNKIFTVGRTFVYNYVIVRHGDSLKITCPFNPPQDADYMRVWDFISHRQENPEKIETISFKVQDSISNERQTEIKYGYQFSADPGFEPFSSTSGVVENGKNVWMHPHRDKYFMILELNPFPYIQRPFKIGTKWTWSLGIGDHWKDDRWKVWSGSITNTYEYEIVSKEELETKIGTLDCWVVEASAMSEIGATGLIAYFHEQYGFVRLDYINIDKSRVSLTISEVRER